MKTIQEIIKDQLDKHPESRQLIINYYYIPFDFSMFNLEIKFTNWLPKDKFLLCNYTVDDTLRYLLEPYVSPEDYKITY